MVIIKTARVIHLSGDGSAWAHALTNQHMLSQHLAADESEARERLKAFIQSVFHVQDVQAGARFRVEYALAQVEPTGRIAQFFSSSEQHFEVSPA